MYIMSLLTRTHCGHILDDVHIVFLSSSLSLARALSLSLSLPLCLSLSLSLSLARARARTHTHTQRPKLLVDAYAHAGTIWRGTGAIKSWALDPNSAKITQPTLVVRGEHDFVTEASQEQWKTACPRARFKSIAGASHHCLLEKTDAYIEMVDAFLAEYD